MWTLNQKIQVTFPRDLKTCLADSTVPASARQRAAPPSTAPKTTAHAVCPRMCSTALLLTSPSENSVTVHNWYIEEINYGTLNEWNAQQLLKRISSQYL